MVKIYLAPSLKNYKLNVAVCNILAEQNISCFLPQRDALEVKLKKAPKDKHEISLKIQKANVKGIKKKADIVLAIAKNLGTDSAWECGFAVELGKPVILLRGPQDLIEDVYMLFNSGSRIIEVSAYKTNELKRVINSIDFESVKRKNEYIFRKFDNGGIRTKMRDS